MKALCFSALLVLFASAGCAHRGVVPEAVPAPIQYRSEYFPYVAGYDLNRWRILSPAERQVVLAQGDLVLADAQAAHFIGVLAEPSTASIAEIRTAALLSLQQEGPDLKVLSQTPVTVSSVPGTLVTLRVTVRGTLLQYRIAFLQYAGFAWRIAYWSREEVFDERAPDYAQFLADFRLRQAAPPKADYAIAYPSPKWGYIVTLPYPEWAPGDERIVRDAEQEFHARSNLAYFTIIPERIALPLAELERRAVARIVESSGGRFHPTESRAVQIDGHAGKLVTGRADIDGVRYEYMLLFVVRGGTAYQFAAWAPDEIFRERYRAQFTAALEGIQFL